MASAEEMRKNLQITGEDVSGVFSAIGNTISNVGDDFSDASKDVNVLGGAMEDMGDKAEK